MDIKGFVQAYGYWAVFLGSLIEGEAIILFASVSAAMGILSIYKVAMISFFGTVVADQGLFFVGHYWGKRVLKTLQEKYPKTIPYISKAHSFVNRFETVYILIFRFIYGIRIISPVVIGSHHVAFKKFAILNVVAAAIWVVVSCSAGYFLGEWIEQQGPVIQILVIAGISMMAGLWMGWSFFQSRRKEKKEREEKAKQEALERISFKKDDESNEMDQE